MDEKIGTEDFFNSKDKKILGIYFDNKLNFNIYLKKLCKKASQKLHALARVSNLMSIGQRKLIMNAFIHSQFSYCPLLWMCHSRIIHTLINNIHERALRIVYVCLLTSKLPHQSWYKIGSLALSIFQ